MKTWTFASNLRNDQQQIILRGRQTLLDAAGRPAQYLPTIKAVFKKGILTTTDEQIADLLLQHPNLNRPDRRGFRLVENASAAAPEPEAQAETIAYKDMSREALVKLCEARLLKSYGNKAELVKLLEQHDAQKGKARKPAGPTEEQKQAIAKKYGKDSLLKMCIAANVEATAQDPEGVLVEALLASGVEFDL